MGIFIGLTRDIYSSVVIYAKEFDLKKSIPRINGLFRMFRALASTLLNDSNEKKKIQTNSNYKYRNNLI